MEANWTIQLKGESHVVRASVPALTVVPRITVQLDGAVIHKQSMVVLLGELCRFNVLGHELTIRLHGFGMLGTLSLLIDGVEAADVLAADEGRLAAPAADPFLEMSITETKRIEEPLGEETREIDNSRSSVSIVRKITVSRDWVQTLVLERESTTKVGGEINLEKAWIVGLKASAEGSVRKKYDLTTEDKRSYSEELTIDVKGNTKVQVVLKWKQLWQCGVVLVRSGQDGAEVQVPFKVCIGPTFDQCQIDS
jgi:hypothetical protein